MQPSIACVNQWMAA